MLRMMREAHRRRQQPGGDTVASGPGGPPTVKRLVRKCLDVACNPFVGLLVLAIGVGVVQADDKKIVGWIERVAITADRLTMDAKVDTGADFSSVHADAISYFMRDSTRWVEFTLRDRNANTLRLSRPLERMARIKKKTQGYQERPVVVLEICVGDAQHPVEVNLARRGHFRYPLLLGRNFLESRFLVDPGAKYLLEPDCD
jgi:hypothetical protein